MADNIEDHASLTIVAMGLLFAHLYVASSPVIPVPSNQSFDGSEDFMTRFHPTVRIITPASSMVPDSEVYVRLLLENSFSVGKSNTNRNVSGVPGAYLGPRPRELLQQGYDEWGQDAYVSAVVRAWARRNWRHVPPILVNKPLSTSIMSSRKVHQCWALPSAIADAAGSSAAEAIAPLPLETPSYMRRRADGTFPSTADVYCYSLNAGLPLMVGEIKPVLDIVASAPVLPARRLAFHKAAGNPKRPICSLEGCGKHARGGLKTCCDAHDRAKRRRRK